MPTFNNDSLELYRANVDLMMAVYKHAQEQYKYGAETESNKIIKMGKYATFNEQLTVAQLGWARAYARRNDIAINISSTQSVDSSTISAPQV